MPLFRSSVLPWRISSSGWPSGGALAVGACRMRPRGWPPTLSEWTVRFMRLRPDEREARPAATPLLFRRPAISLPEPRKLALEAFGVSPPYGAPRGPELAPAARGVGMGPRLKTPSTQFTYFDVHAHTDTPQSGPSAV